MVIAQIVKFLKNDIWRIRLKHLPRKKSFLIKQLRIILLALRGFDEDKCILKASSLTYYSLLSIVPALGIAFGVAKGFGLDTVLEEKLMGGFESHEEVMIRIVDFSRSLLEKTEGGLIAGIGLVVLFWLVIKVLGNVEQAFNDIWGVKKPRTIWRRLSDYLAIIIICPVLLILSSSVTVFIASQVKLIAQQTALSGAVDPVVLVFLKLVPYCVIFILFTFIYIFIPNTRVSWKSALLAGIVAGAAYEVGQWVYITFQIGVANYNAIYGSFAALPLFLVWIQLSWLIVLFGAELSFAHQNVGTYEFEPDCLRASYSFKRLLALRIVNLLIKNFCKGEKSWTATQLSQALEIPIRLVRKLLYDLTESGIVAETCEDSSREASYQPAQCTDRLTIKYVTDALEACGSEDIPVEESKELQKLSDCLKSLSDTAEKSPANILLKEL